MKQFKKLGSLLLALVMVLALAMPAFATRIDSEFNSPAPTFMPTPETEIKASGLDEGDGVDCYQLVEWKDGDWALTDLGNAIGLDLDTIISVGITEAVATEIANYVDTNKPTAEYHMPAAGADGKTSVSNVDAGLYYLKATPTNPDTVYNPAFVSADYYQGNNEVSFSDTIGDSAVLKKSTTEFDKSVNDTDPLKYLTIKPGDEIPYVINTVIPSYGSTFTNPVFKITDKLPAELAFSQVTEDSHNVIVVEYGSVPSVMNLVYEGADKSGSLDGVITVGVSGNTLTVEFAEDYLLNLDDAKADRTVKITYWATVTDAAATSANIKQMDNDATLDFSGNRDVEHKYDTTRHYTFSIGGDLFGQTGENGYEIVKVACDEQGNVITGTQNYWEVTNATPLAGAEFSLTPAVFDSASSKYVKVPNATPDTCTTGTDGRISFEGLTEGYYILEETKAPDGYVKDGEIRVIHIEGTYVKPSGEGNYGDEADVLESYVVEILKEDGTSAGGSSTFEITNDGGTITKAEDKTGSTTGLIKNTLGSELPSTGGIGTTIFYIVGGVLLVGAVVLLIAKRRTSVDDE